MYLVLRNEISSRLKSNFVGFLWGGSVLHFQSLDVVPKLLAISKKPVYLRSLIATSLPSRSLRSNRGISLSAPRIKTNSGARAFSSCAPSLWNNLPLFVLSATSVATFRRRLKTYLFDLASLLPGRHRCAQWPSWCFGIAWTTSYFEHRSDCCATEPGYAGDIGAIEIWLSDLQCGRWLFIIKKGEEFIETVEYNSKIVQRAPVTFILFNYAAV